MEPCNHSSGRRLQILSHHLTGIASGPETPPDAPLQGSLEASPAACSAIHIEDRVQTALRQGQAVVALESTIISHGMPYPQNLQMAREVEAIVKAQGAIPATVAVIGGVPKVGLSDAELELLAKAGRTATKTARRDLAGVMARRGLGATTVSTTMLLAARAGIHVFVTGGIGGVHRGVESTMDVSSDLTELGRTPVAVICAGAKSVLDIPRTLEYLETQGVTVAGYQTGEFPAFFTRHSGCKVPCRIASAEECAALIDANLQLELGSGVVIAVPIPEDAEAAARPVELAIHRALKEAEGSVTGAEVTPFLLKRVSELTRGDSLTANIALVKNNAAIGAQIAVALAKRRKTSA